MKTIKTWDIERLFDYFKHWLISNKMVLIKSLLTGALCDRSKLVYGYLNEVNKACKCYSCLKLMVQAYFDADFLKISFKHVLYKTIVIKHNFLKNK